MLKVKTIVIIHQTQKFDKEKNEQKSFDQIDQLIVFRVTHNLSELELHCLQSIF